MDHDRNARLIHSDSPLNGTFNIGMWEVDGRAAPTPGGAVHLPEGNKYPGLSGGTG